MSESSVGPDQASGKSPVLECDLVLKGGVTSGVLYPPAVLALAERFRFRAIGGASAGAIAAGLTAAAEYGRQRPAKDADTATIGFAGLAKLSASLAEAGFLFKRLKPSAPFAPLMQAFIAFNTWSQRVARWPPVARFVGKALTVPVVVLGSVPFAAIAGVLLVGILAWPLGRDAALLWSVLGGVVALAAIFAGLLVGGVGSLLLRARRLRRPDSARFGICTGSAGKAANLADESTLALTDWLHVWINRLAGKAPDDSPLTIAELAADAAVELKVMTANLTLAQPFVLPLARGSRSFFFRPKDLADLFPPVVTRYLENWGRANATNKLLFPPRVPGDTGNEFLRFPFGPELPVVVAVRLSLSFPLLLSAVRLHAFTDDAYGKSKRGEPLNLAVDAQPHWLSDGGITNNFPIHLFDSWLPDRPTFGITLYDSPVSTVLAQKEMGPSVVLPLPSDFNHARPPRTTINTTLDFLRAIFQAAQSHHDVSMSGLPSYRERIVQIFLDSTEGGLNLDMDPATIKGLQDKGKRAAAELLERFVGEGARFSDGYYEHVWVRLLVLLGQLEKEFARVRLAGGNTAWRTFVHDQYRDLLARQLNATRRWYRGRDQPWSAEAATRLDALLDLVEAWGRPPGECFAIEPPRPEGRLRVTAND